MPIGTNVSVRFRRFVLRLREIRFALLTRVWKIEKSVGEALVSHANRHLPDAVLVQKLEAWPIYEDRY